MGRQVHFIYIAKVKAFGEVVDALRIRTKIPTIKQFKCECCGSVILGTSTKSAEEIVAMGKSYYGKELCLKCAKFEQEKKKAEAEKKEVKTNLS